VIYIQDTSKLQFRHSDNINFFFAACKAIELPDVFMFELIDLYDKKNIPKVIYCIHALRYKVDNDSHLLHKKGLAPRIKDLLGKLEFSGFLH
jgi:Calponin homology (CH) domain